MSSKRMMSSPRGRAKKRAQLGMDAGTASHQLKKSILFHFIQILKKDICHQCGNPIESVNDLSVEHIIPWLDSDDPKGLFFDLNNIAFSHPSCNYSARRCYHKGDAGP
jgi:hypothetical protein